MEGRLVWRFWYSRGTTFPFQHLDESLAFVGGAILLFAAARLVWDGHFDERFLEKGGEDLVPKLGAIGSLSDFHQIVYGACND